MTETCDRCGMQVGEGETRVCQVLVEGVLTDSWFCEVCATKHALLEQIKEDLEHAAVAAERLKSMSPSKSWYFPGLLKDMRKSLGGFSRLMGMEV